MARSPLKWNKKTSPGSDQHHHLNANQQIQVPSSPGRVDYLYPEDGGKKLLRDISNLIDRYGIIAYKT